MIRLDVTQTRIAFNAMRVLIGIVIVPTVILSFKLVVEAFLILSITAMLVPVIDTLRLPLRMDRKGVAGILAVLYLIADVLGMYTLLPHIAKGAIDSMTSLTMLSQDLPLQFERGWRHAQDILQMWFRVDADGIKAAQVWVGQHIGTIAMKSADILAWAGGLFVRGSLTAAVGFLLPFFVLFVYAYWTKESAVACSVMRRLVRAPYDDIVMTWWQTYVTCGTKLLRAIALMMLGFVVTYTTIFLVMAISGWPISISQAIFFGIVLGVIGGIPTIGGVMNWFVSVIIGLATFGFEHYWAVTFLFLVSFIMREIEAWYVTPVLLGSSLQFTPIGMMMCFVIGLSVWGMSFTGVAMSLLLIPFLSACMALVDSLDSVRAPGHAQDIAAAHLCAGG